MRPPSAGRSARSPTAGTATRRRFLGALGSAVGVTTLGGCLSGAGDEPERYTDWLASPDLFGGRRYFFDYYDVAAIRNNREAFDAAVYDAYREWAARGYDHFGLQYEAIDAELLSVNQRQVVLWGDWDLGALDDRLKESGYVESDPRGGFDFYRHRMAQMAIGVNENHLLRSKLTDLSPLGTARLFADVGQGEKPRYTESDAVISELVGRLGGGTYVYGFPHIRRDSTNVEYARFRGAEAKGLARTVDGAETTDRVVVTFSDESDVSDARGDVETWTERAPLFDGVEGIEIETEGRSVVVSLQRRTADLDEITPRI